MRRPEGETELPRFENSPAYKFARAIHEKDPSPLVMQQGIYPRTSGQQAVGGQYSQFDYRNLPWSEEVWGEGIVDEIPTSHVLSIGNLKYDDVQPKTKVVVGADGIVRRLENTDQLAFDRDEEDDDAYQPPSVMKVNVLSDKSVRAIVERIGTINLESDNLDTLLDTDDNSGIPATSDTVELLKSTIEKFSGKRKMVKSSVDLAGDSYEISTDYENDTPVSVGCVRHSVIDGVISRTEFWGFNAELPPTFRTTDTPKFSDTKPIEQILMEYDLIKQTIRSNVEANASGGDLADGKEVKEGLKILERISKSWRKKYRLDKSYPESDSIND